MPPKGRKNTSQNNSKGLTEPDPPVQEVMEESSRPPQKNPSPVTSTGPTAAPESTTPEENQVTPTEEPHTQRNEPTIPPEDNLDKELQAAEKQIKYLQIQQWIRALKIDIAWSQRSIISSEPLYKKAQEQDQITPDSHPTDLTAPTPQDLTPTVPSAQNHHVATTDNHQEDLESENKVLNKPLIKKAVLETYWSRGSAWC